MIANPARRALTFLVAETPIGSFPHLAERLARIVLWAAPMPY